MVRWIAAIVLGVVMSGCGLLGPAKIQITGAEVLEAKVSELSATDLNFSCICDSTTTQTTTPAFMVIRNAGGEADRLIKVETDRAVRVEFRRGNGVDDLTAVVPLQSVEIPPMGKVEFAGGKYYMILTGLKDNIKPGDMVPLTLYFEKSGPVQVEASVRPR